MSLGTKLQAISAKVNTKLGSQDVSITFRTQTRTPGAHSFANETVVNDDTVITSGCEVYPVKAESLRGPGPVELGDIKFVVPAHLLSESKAKNPSLKVLYDGRTWNPYSVRPSDIVSGIPVEWVIMARYEEQPL